MNFQDLLVEFILITLAKLALIKFNGGHFGKMTMKINRVTMDKI